MRIDAHMHMDDEETARLLKEQGIVCIANASNPKEYAWLQKLAVSNPLLIISAGIHPWHVKDSSWETMLPVLETVDIIGEIGLDNVWCQTDAALQSILFEKQLAYAQKYKKPVILHVKGMEKEALDMLCRYENHYLVHWYSCMSYIQEYIDAGCWFTVGPSLPYDDSVKAIAQKVPLNRLLVETDGISACSWCENRSVTKKEYLCILDRSMKLISDMRHISKGDLEIQMERNCEAFMMKQLPR